MPCGLPCMCGDRPAAAAAMSRAAWLGDRSGDRCRGVLELDEVREEAFEPAFSLPMTPMVPPPLPLMMLMVGPFSTGDGAFSS